MEAGASPASTKPLVAFVNFLRDVGGSVGSLLATANVRKTLTCARGPYYERLCDLSKFCDANAVDRYPKAKIGFSITPS
jgi:hypothetical protein